MFTREQVKKEAEELLAGKHPYPDNAVWDAWCDMATGWLSSENASDYFWDGFKGFSERTPNEILLDFHFGNLLEDPLTEEEVEKLFD